jgi:uncharacterized membrane protein YdjX (TVP38/TMEM64 family)
MTSTTTRIAASAALLVALGAAALLVDLPSLGEIRATIASVGPLAPVAFLLVYAVVVLLPVPKSVLSAAAGLAFGLPLGVALVLTAATTGAIGAFLLARALGREAVGRLAHGHLDRLDARLERHGLLTALVVRLVPVMPFTPLNYACGVTAMRLPHYAIGTAIGLIPGTCLLVGLGSAGSTLSPWYLIAVSAGLAATWAVVGYVRFRCHRELTESRPGSSTA